MHFFVFKNHYYNNFKLKYTKSISTEIIEEQNI
jgi:hypothetical protein